MSCDNVFKDIAVIHARLFDHRPVLQGHVSFFVKEFEDKRGERESLRLNSTLKNLLYIGTQGVPNSVTALDDSLRGLCENVDAATKSCENVGNREGKREESFLMEERQRREKEWAEFIALQCERSATVDEEFQSQIEALRNHYSDLEHKLKSSATL